MEPQSIPKISASLSLTPTTHSFTSEEAPILYLIITSHHPTPITIYADDLSPKLMLTCGAFIITDLTTGTEVRQSTRTHCRIPPPSKVAVTLNHQLFHTLLPNTPLALSAPFTRSHGHAASNGGGDDGGDGGSSKKPLAKHDPDYARVDSLSSASSSTAKYGACGVDGLEPGHRYLLGVAEEKKSRVPWYVVRWWEFGTKEEVLSGGTGTGGGGLDGRQVRFGRAPHEKVVIDSKTVGVVEFECRD